MIGTIGHTITPSSREHSQYANRFGHNADTSSVETLGINSMADKSLAYMYLYGKPVTMAKREEPLPVTWDCNLQRRYST